MATNNGKTPRPAIIEAPGFDVTCTIGRVEFNGLGDYTPEEAAFLLIARHGADGTYTFPSEAAGPTSVTVETAPNPAVAID